MKMHIACSVATCCIALGALAGCAANKASQSAGAVNCSNTACPFSGKSVNAAYASSYKDKTVGFCCPNCKAKFDAMSDADKAKMVATASK